MENEDVHFSDIFAKPGTWVGVAFVAPAWVGPLTRSGSSGPSTVEAEELSVEAEEMGPNQAAAWGKGGGLAAFRSRLDKVCHLLGGEVVMQTWKGNRTGNERHEVMYEGPEVDC